MATTAATQTRDKAAEASLRWGSWLMGIAAVGFIGYAVIFLVRNFTDRLPGARYRPQ
jgi:sugar phosphate permease